MRELPPVLSGTEAQQLSALRDYLVRMARSLDVAEVETNRMIQKAAESKPAASGGSSIKGLEEIKQQIGTLRDLIIKTSDEVRVVNETTGIIGGMVDTNSSTTAEVLKVLGISTDYIAQSDFGAYEQKLSSEILATAQDIIERFDYWEKVKPSVDGEITAVVDGVSEALSEYQTLMQGMIVRGYIIVDGVMRFGIAVARDLKTTGNTVVNNGLVYTELQNAQTFGFYGSEGWEYWVDGVKTAWVDSQTSTLRVSNARVDESTMMSGAWQWKEFGGLGLKYIGN